MSAHPSPSRAQTRKPRGQGATRRDEILAAATRLFTEQGVESVTMRAIAGAVGVSATALYVYFPDKDAIMRAIAESSFQRLRSVLEAAVAGRDGPEAQLRAGMAAYAQFALDHPDEYSLVFMRPRTSGNMKDDIPEADHSFSILLNSVDAMIAAGLFPTCPAMLAAELLWAAMHGVIALTLSCRDALQTAPETLSSAMIDVAVDGLKRALAP